MRPDSSRSCRRTRWGTTWRPGSAAQRRRAGLHSICRRLDHLKEQPRVVRRGRGATLGGGGPAGRRLQSTCGVDGQAARYCWRSPMRGFFSTSSICAGLALDGGRIRRSSAARLVDRRPCDAGHAILSSQSGPCDHRNHSVPALIKAWKYDPKAPENLAYYGVSFQTSSSMAAFSGVRVRNLSVMTFEVA